MATAPSLDGQFRSAVAALDAGDLAELDRLLTAHPRLVHDRLDAPGPWLREQVGDALDGFFRQPYLLWFVAEDPVRKGRLPANIAELARLIVGHAERARVSTLQEQIDYALRLVAWSWIARECDVQLGLLDVLVDAGAAVDGRPEDALTNGNLAAAAHLVDRGAALTLATALCLERWDEAGPLTGAATVEEKQFALVLVAVRGRERAIAWLLDHGVDPDTTCPHLYSHATALHHAVSSGSLEAVRLLVEAGADVSAKDTAWQGTPLDWAEYGNRLEISAYLRGRPAT